MIAVYLKRSALHMSKSEKVCVLYIVSGGTFMTSLVCLRVHTRLRMSTLTYRYCYKEGKSGVVLVL